MYTPMKKNHYIQESKHGGGSSPVVSCPFVIPLHPFSLRVHPSLYLPPQTNTIPFCHYRLPIEFYVNGTIRHILLLDWILSLRTDSGGILAVVSTVCSCLLLNSKAFCRYTIICLSTHLLMEIWVAYTLGL